MDTNKTVWVLTYEVNEYDYHGKYFAAVFAQKPTVRQLLHYMLECESHDFSYGVGSKDPLRSLDFLLHILEGGGRVNNEPFWYNLTEEKLYPSGTI